MGEVWVRCRGGMGRYGGERSLGTLAAETKPMMPSMARRPLLISATRPLAFFSGEAFLEMPA